MGVFTSRGRSDSRASALSRHEQPAMAEEGVQNGSEAAVPIGGPTNPSYNNTASGSLRPETPYTGTSLRTPARSFYHRSLFHGSQDPAQYSSQGVREQTAELASLALSDAESALSGTSLPKISDIPPILDLIQPDQHDPEVTSKASSSATEGLKEIPELPSAQVAPSRQPSSSALTEMIRNSPPSDTDGQEDGEGQATPRPALTVMDESEASDNEQTSLIRKPSRSSPQHGYGSMGDIENQIPVTKRQNIFTLAHSKGEQFRRFVLNPKSWDRRTVWEEGVVRPISLLPSVFLGLLLNILDALSYGMILFPLGEPIFADLGSDGISMFYVSTIIAQLVFSSGGSIFRGGVGSEMIEVVPFFHKMAFMILNKVGEDNPKSVLATTILSFSMSSVLTGLVFFLMGACKLGSLIGFFPRHILIGCIGGVGWFLIATGVEVSGRLPGSLEYNLETLHKLFQFDTIFLWTIPLLLAVFLLVLKRFIKSNFLVGGYFIVVAGLFYVIISIAKIPLSTLRDSGWVFDAPSSNNPWYHFYTLYDFSAVNWTALVDTIPAMFALTFFGVLHVPINVPALGISTGEDNLNVDRELIAHGVTNALSGFAGSIQNYLVYTNSLLFIDSGGNSRLAGILLAVATGGILLVGPVIIGFIPIMVVGALIFLLGIELMEEALVDTWGKLHRLEYLTVVIIVVTMGAWDFVAGILVGIILACVNFVVQTSRKSAIRATYSGAIAGSTVRRHPIQQRYLKEAGQQTLIIKLAGFLFFGTIVKVENTTRGLIEEEAFTQRPIRFLVLDLSRVYGLDFSAAEAFTRINRILRKRNVQTIIAGINVEGEVGRSLQNVGLFDEDAGVEIFEDLNSALEFCENDYLKVFYSRKEALSETPQQPTQYLEVPKAHGAPLSADTLFNSPRRRYLHQVATTTLREDEAVTAVPPKWSTFRQPLPLLLQTFQGLTTQNEDFWFPATAYFVQEFYPAGTVLFHEGDLPRNFYLLESGMLRAEYHLPQGQYFELIVAGRPCGELPFFSETPRTATVTAEQDCTAWCLSAEKWEELRENEPQIAQELLRVGLKLTAERMESITAYVLTMAG
ncbi:sulfate transporter family protein [Paecilomyces variotii No. 5]|uniref:Sulfate transporter family protein n=1 Tax=Byssochlamys spectabilis (strain No. 5 / NBRC 109023) TaxID=1356009 RepID=V5FUD1_BYSSN|nr:sulfate transporter family protein [Paecilomyces variotii No. 5]